MRSFELNFFPKPEKRGDELRQFGDLLESFLVWLSKNGNLVGEWNILERDECVQARIIAPERKSLDEEFFCSYAREDLAKLREISLRPPQFVCVPDKAEETCCLCRQPGSYVLFTNFIDFESPVACGDCRRAVPLYRLPHIENEKSHEGLLNWQATYAALDTLYMFSSIGERFGYRHLSGPRGEFMRRTRNLAKQLEEKSQTPVYSFVLHSYRQFDDNCPLCKRSWRMKEPQGIFDFKCEHCRIVSTEAVDEALELKNMHP